MKTRHNFSRTDMIAVVQQFRKKMTDYEQLANFEKQKSDKLTDENKDLLEKLKNSKMECKIYQQKLD
jgi:3-dehydroquinate dehydratase